MTIRRPLPGRVSVALVLTLLLLVALWVLLSLGLAALMGHFRHLYAQIIVPPDQTAWIELRGNRLRLAQQVEDLESAPWVSASHVTFGPTRFGPLALPSPPAELPGEWGQSQAYLNVSPFACQAEWQLVRADEVGARWAYTVRTQVQTARSAGEAPANDISRLAKPVLELHAEQQYEAEGEHFTIGVAVTMSSSSFDQLDITRDGHPPDVMVQIRDPDGNVVESKTGPLDLFGYT